MVTMRTWAWVGASLLVLSGCDKGAAPAGPSGSASQKAPSSEAPRPEAPKAPEPPRAPAITVDEHGCTIDGKAFTTSPAEWRDAAGALLATKPLVAGEAVVVNVMRDAKAPTVETILSALAHAKAKSVLVRTPTRDQSSGEITLKLEHGAVRDCSVVAMIEHDGTVAVWSKAGGGAQRFARGMAGPDLTSANDALRKHAASCDSPVWFLGAADAVPWGLAFDLAMRAKAADAGANLRPTEAIFLTHHATPGRPITDE
jgi:hypothetical protein